MENTTITIKDTRSVFEILSNQDISKFVKSVNFRNGSSLKYLPWASAWGIVKNNFPDANYTVYENDMGWDYFTDTRYCWVKVGVTINGLEHIVKRPVYNQRNEAIPYSDVNMGDINKAHMRALCKACAMHGLGLSLWLGLEDMDWDKAERAVEKKSSAVKSTQQAVMPPVPKTVAAPKAESSKPVPAPEVAAVASEPAPKAEAPNAPAKAETVVEVKTEAETPKTEKAETKRFVCNKDGKLWYGSEVFEFTPKVPLELDPDPAKAKAQISELGKQAFTCTDVKLKAYTNQPVYKVFWDMVKTLDADALRVVQKYLSVPMEAELPDDQKNLPHWEKLPENCQTAINAFAQIATYELTSRKFKHPKA